MKAPAAISMVMLAVSAWAVDDAAGQSWQTVADFESVSLAAVDALAADSAGNLYAAVAVSDPDARMHAQIWKSSDRGDAWTMIEDLESVVDGTVRFCSLGTDPAGHLYAVGYVTDQQGQTRWLVRKSNVGGSAWTKVDEFALPGGQTTVAQGFAAGARGTLYVAGYGNEPSTECQPLGRKHWLLRQSRDGGRSWTTLEDFGYRHSARAAAILSAAEGLFVAGSGWDGKCESGERWLVRKGTKDGQGVFQWQTVDEFRLEESVRGFQSQAQGMASDGRGNLYSVGRGYGEANGGTSAHWIVRRASRGGLDWELVDKFQLEPGRFATAWGVMADGAGEVYVVGQAMGREHGCGHWIVRHSATGRAGSWRIHDGLSILSTESKLASFVLDAFHQQSRTGPGKWYSGLAILCDGQHVWAGGSAFNGSGHGLIRRLDLTSTTELTTARTP